MKETISRVNKVRAHKNKERILAIESFLSLTEVFSQINLEAVRVLKGEEKDTLKVSAAQRRMNVLLRPVLPKDELKQAYKLLQSFLESQGLKEVTL